MSKKNFLNSQPNHQLQDTSRRNHPQIPSAPAGILRVNLTLHLKLVADFRVAAGIRILTLVAQTLRVMGRVRQAVQRVRLEILAQIFVRFPVVFPTGFIHF